MESSYIKIEWKEKLCRAKESIDLEHMKQCKWMVQVKEGWTTKRSKYRTHAKKL